MRVALVAAAHLAIVGLVAGVDMRVLFPVRAVGEPAIATLEFALERLLSCELVGKTEWVVSQSISRLTDGQSTGSPGVASGCKSRQFAGAPPNGTPRNRQRQTTKPIVMLIDLAPICDSGAELERPIGPLPEPVRRRCKLGADWSEQRSQKSEEPRRELSCKWAK